MEKRFTLFVVLSALVLLTHLWIQAKLNPPKPKKPDVAQVDEAGAEGKNGEPGDPPGDGNQEPRKPAELTPNDKPTATKEPGPEKENDPATPAKPAAVSNTTNAPPKHVTLGSLDPATGYRMLVTLSSAGGAVERIELSSPRYRDLENSYGYLGHLALENSGDGQGCDVHVVGAGTPAALAKSETGPATGLEPGDTIRELDGKPLADRYALEEALKKTKPGDEAKLVVQRGNSQMVFVVTLGHQPLEVIRPEPVSGEADPLSFLFTLESIGSGKKSAKIATGEREIAKLVSLHNSHWEISKASEDEVEFQFVVGEDALQKINQTGELKLVRRYRLAPTPAEKNGEPTFRSYHLEMDLEIRSQGKEPQQIAYRLGGPTGLPTEGWWYGTKISSEWRDRAGARDVAYRVEGSDHHRLKSASLILSEAKKKPEAPQTIIFDDEIDPAKRTLRYIGGDTQYFSAFLLPATAEDKLIYRRATAVPIGDFTTVKKGYEPTLNTSFNLSSEPRTLGPDETIQQKFIVFAGPKDPPLLDQYGLKDSIEYGWWGWVVGPMSFLLNKVFYWGNYGVAIVLLTILVRSCMLPVSFKMTKNAQKMQALAPEMKKIADKYKNDMEKRGKAQQELFAKHGVNMYSGCLLVFLQLPIFAGLYRLLAVDINLRQSPLIPGWDWCSNLAGPDKFWHWQGIAPGFLADETGYFGPYLNILPLFTVGLFIMNQKLLTPPATDEQTRMQQKIMSFMMIFFAVMFFKVPSGLCLYFIASSLWTLAEHKILKKNKTATAPPLPEPATRSGGRK